MNRKKVFLEYIGLVLVLVIFTWIFYGCPVGKQQPITAQRTFMEAQNAYLSSWSSYERAWLLLPDTDPRKKQWAKDYHPTFIQAGELLLAWSATPDSYDSSADRAIAAAEDILLKLAIKKGGK